MVPPSKANRPKRRWVGICFFQQMERESIESLIDEILPSSSARLYDLISIDYCRDITIELDTRVMMLGIVRVNLSELDKFISKCENESRLMTVTTSGKIRLVRKRLGIDRPKVRR